MIVVGVSFLIYAGLSWVLSLTELDPVEALLWGAAVTGVILFALGSLVGERFVRR